MNVSVDLDMLGFFVFSQSSAMAPPRQEIRRVPTPTHSTRAVSILGFSRGAFWGHCMLAQRPRGDAMSTSADTLSRALLQ